MHCIFDFSKKQSPHEIDNNGKKTYVQLLFSIFFLIQVEKLLLWTNGSITKLSKGSYILGKRREENQTCDKIK